MDVRPRAYIGSRGVAALELRDEEARAPRRSCNSVRTGRLVGDLFLSPLRTNRLH